MTTATVVAQAQANAYPAKLQADMVAMQNRPMYGVATTTAGTNTNPYTSSNPPFKIDPVVLKSLRDASFDWGPEKGLDDKLAVCQPCAAVVLFGDGGWERHRAGCKVMWPETDVDDI